MDWIVHFYDHRSQTVKASRAFKGRESALQHACDLETDHFVVRYVEGPVDRIMPPQIMEWCRGHKTARNPPNPVMVHAQQRRIAGTLELLKPGQMIGPNTRSGSRGSLFSTTPPSMELLVSS